MARLLAVVAAASVVLVVVTVLALAMPAARTLIYGQARPLPQASYALGDRLELDPALYRDAERNVFLFARASCGACQASKQTMASLVSKLAGLPDVTVTFVSSLKQSEEDRAFGREIGVTSPRIIKADISSLRLRYVPSVVVTDRNGAVVWSHEGILTDIARAEAVEAARNRSTLQ